MKLLLFTGLLFASISQSFSQNITAFEITNGSANKLFLFDSGVISTLEYQNISDLHITNQSVAYADSRGDYYIVNKGNKQRVTQGKTSIEGDNNLLVYKISSVLRVFDQGKTNLLTSYAGSHAFGDSLVVFQDRVGGNLKYYYNDSIVEFAQVLGNYFVNPNQVGNNTFVYQDNAGNYKGFYKWNFYELFNSNKPVKFKSGTDIIAFNDPINYSFSMFEKGELIDIENQLASKYEVGNGFVYYQDNNGVNKVYFDGEISELGYDLQEIQIYDSIIFFKEANYPKIWYNNEIYTLYNSNFTSYQVSGGILAYPNTSGGVSAFIRGKEVDISNQKIQSYLLKGNTIVLKFTSSAFSVWWNGKMFNY